MNVSAWNERYRSRQRLSEDFDAAPTPLLVETARNLHAGTALDLACGTGRNAIWLAEYGWNVTAVDGAESAIDTLRNRASAAGLEVEAIAADLTKGEYQIQEASWDLIAICYYLQRDLFEPAKRGVAPGGVLLAIVHITEKREHPSETRLRPGELEQYFQGWHILHRYEGKPADEAHRRAVAEVVARRPR